MTAALGRFSFQFESGVLFWSQFTVSLVRLVGIHAFGEINFEIRNLFLLISLLICLSWWQIFLIHCEFDLLSLYVELGKKVCMLDCPSMFL